jgi:murein L,D-transpeptidase YcbB/YkuD
MLRTLLVFCWVTGVGLLYACGGNEKVSAFEAKRDTTITPANEYNPLHLDSLTLAEYVVRENLSDQLKKELFDFYIGRNFQYAWFKDQSLNEHAYSFYHAQSNFIAYNLDSSFYNAKMDRLLDSLQNDSTYKIDINRRPEIEMLLSTQFFRFASRAFEGSQQIKTADLGWYIPRKKIDLVQSLDALLTGNLDSLQIGYLPQYRELRKHLIEYYQIEKSGGWPIIRTSLKKLKKGDQDTAVLLLKKRLYITGDMQAIDSSLLFDEAVEAGVKSFQQRYGLIPTGEVNTGLLSELNVPIRMRIEQMLVNMERMRWAPAQGNEDFLFVNIPAFKLYVYEQGKLSFDMNVVVGKSVHKTVIFNGSMKHVVFAPYWNVPYSIVKNEIVPAMQRNKNYISRNNMEITGYSGGLPVVRQKPGPKNALGKVKFLFPNSYNIYLHDTPSKGLFSNETRAFSHGCIRLAEPKKLATFLLRNQSQWDNDKIDAAMNGSKETWVNLNKPVPVAIGYFTAWVDRNGKLNFRDDIYGHDKALREQLFLKK